MCYRSAYRILKFAQGNFLAVKSNTQRSKRDEFYFVGFVQVRNSHVFRLEQKIIGCSAVLSIFFSPSIFFPRA